MVSLGLKLLQLGPIFLLKPRPLMILLEGFLVILMIGLTKNPSRRIIIGLGLSRKIGPSPNDLNQGKN